MRFNITVDYGEKGYNSEGGLLFLIWKILNNPRAVIRISTWPKKELVMPKKVGLYKLYWKSGGSSLASVGCNEKGDLWFAPTNWIVVPSYDWKTIKKVEFIK